ncbi:hypothetical protein ACH5RR_040060 [Cinchona calisaya]|uniref:Beta-1,3-N-Acetylglucosaminyltransferase family protein n=1 Tax=Cinchona calisaya TaxID=153742 RepID=A0ABD2XV48_9GENT
MAAIVKILCLSLFLGVVSADCSLANLTILQAPTGAKVESKPQWNLTIFNQCICTQTQVKLSCKGFQSVEKIDPTVLLKTGDSCLVNNGAPIHYGHDNFTFTYAADKQFPFTPIDSLIFCS